ncbi:MAG: ABC transporter permease [Fimbriimonas sp.]
MSVTVQRRRLPGAAFYQSLGVLIAFIVLMIGYAIWRPDIVLNPEFLPRLVNQNAAVGIVAIFMTLVIIGGGIDLSVGSMMGLTASLGLLALNKLIGDGTSQSVATLAAVVVSVAVGAFLGAVNGIAITWGKIAPFIVTLAGMAAYRSIATVLAAGGEIRSSSSEVFAELGRGGLTVPFLVLERDRALIITWPVIVFFLSALVAGFLLNWTRYGRHLIAVGANEKAAIYSAINTSKVKVYSYVLMGLFAGAAAIGLAGRMNSVSTSQLGLYYELDAIAAVVIGGTSMSGGRGRIWTTVIGVLLLGLITNMLVTSGLSVYWQGAVKGVIILLAVLIQRGHSD